MKKTNKFFNSVFLILFICITLFPVVFLVVGSTNNNSWVFKSQFIRMFFIGIEYNQFFVWICLSMVLSHYSFYTSKPAIWRAPSRARRPEAAIP